ncbi:hypothetical protein Pcinc_007499 [Petrolisthes cinctipes]|uniref:Uncharacterized protein n=1 Tax=Petrolisthes cinctipes TaxID=88211 RepID=A0AAE1KY53_PETCI|nr:hypothetical protein Pcinc_007499 [Petrolisthes cinctipes]
MRLPAPEWKKVCNSRGKREVSVVHMTSKSEKSPAGGKTMRQKDAAGRKETIQQEEGKKCDGDSFEEKNKLFFVLFRVLGLVTLRRMEGRYQVSTLHFFVSYLAWTTSPFLGYIASLVWLHLRGNAQHYPLGGLFVILILCFMPAVQTYSLKYINQSLPAALDHIDTLIHLQPGFKTPLTVFEGKTCEVIKKKIENAKMKTLQERLFQWLPLTMVVISGGGICVSLSVKMMKNVDVSTVMNGLPLLIGNVFFQCLPFASTFFIAAFLKWLTRVYVQLAKHCKLTLATWTPSQALNLRRYLEQLQELFMKMNVGFLQFTVSTNIISISASSILCWLSIIIDNNIIYVGPLVGNVVCLVVVSEAAANLVIAVSTFHLAYH